MSNEPFSIIRKKNEEYAIFPTVFQAKEHRWLFRTPVISLPEGWGYQLVDEEAL